MNAAGFELWMAITLGIVIPVLVWCYRMHAMVKQTLAMHQNPDEHGFGTNRTNELLDKHMNQERDMHQATIDTMKALNRTTAELSHYIRWSTEQILGKKPPPFIDPHK